MSTQSLGRGLDSLLGPENAEDHSSENTEVALSLLQPNPWQPREDFNQESLEELANSIKKQGIIQPLLVRQMPDGNYQIIAGERRFRAAKIAGLTSVPVFVRSMTDAEVMTAALIENLQREDLNPLEEALALKSLRDALELTQEGIAEKLGRSRSSVANSLRLLQLSEQAQQDLKSGAISAGHARCLLAISDQDLAEKLRVYIVRHELTVRDVEDLISKWKKTGEATWLEDEPQAPEDAPKPQEKKSSRLKKTPLAKKMQALISEIMECQATVLGNEEQGKITLTYASSAELQNILEKIGANPVDQETADESQPDADPNSTESSNEAEDSTNQASPEEVAQA